MFIFTWLTPGRPSHIFWRHPVGTLGLPVTIRYESTCLGLKIVIPVEIKTYPLKNVCFSLRFIQKPVVEKGALSSLPFPLLVCLLLDSLYCFRIGLRSRGGGAKCLRIWASALGSPVLVSRCLPSWHVSPLISLDPWRHPMLPGASAITSPPYGMVHPTPALFPLALSYCLNNITYMPFFFSEFNFLNR